MLPVFQNTYSSNRYSSKSPFIQYHLWFKKEKETRRKHCNKGFLRCFETHAQILLLRHQAEASSAKRRKTTAFKRRCFTHLNIKKDFREPKLQAEDALGDVGTARPVAGWNGGRVLWALKCPENSGWGQNGWNAAVTTVETMSQAVEYFLCPSHFITDIQKLQPAKSRPGVKAGQKSPNVGEGNSQMISHFHCTLKKKEKLSASLFSSSALGWLQSRTWRAFK